MSPTNPVRSATYDVEFDQGRHFRAKLGFVLLATEQTIEDDVAQLRPDGVGVHFARIPTPDEITNETLATSAEMLAPAAATLLPDGSLDVISYACTSGSLVVGEKRVFAEFQKGAPGARPTSIISAVIRALKAVDARRIVVGSPYLDAVNTTERNYLQAAGFEVLDIQGLNITRDSDMVRVTPAFLRDFTIGLNRPEADAVFISCGALRTLDVIGEIEAAVGKPAICSNQAMMWDALRLAGVEDRITGFGSLLAER
ncbi:MAG: arylmalonate decarboxylase [Rhodobacteraceae bacterium]|nr:arylmalonate decarboxylase [Paracoccaceae bacterium]